MLGRNAALDFAANGIRGMGARQDVAAAVHYLVSDASRYITGIEIPVEGGFFVS